MVGHNNDHYHRPAKESHIGAQNRGEKETEKKVRSILQWSKGEGNNWGFLCSLNGEDHFYGNLFLLLRKRKTLVHHIRNVQVQFDEWVNSSYSSASGLKTRFKST